MKKYLIILSVVLMVGLVIAAGLSATDKNVTIEKDKLDVLKDKLNVSSVDIDAGSISCDDTNCWASIYSPNLISTQWRTQSKYCTEYNETLNEQNETTGECITYSDYSNAELETMRDEWVKGRIEGYADAIVEREQAVTEKVGGGVLTLTDK